jgi:glycosyl transferase family 25
MYKFIIIILVLSIIYYFNPRELFYNTSNFEITCPDDKEHCKDNLINNYINNYNNIDIYVISLRHKERLNNIEIQKNKININISNFMIYDAVNGNNLDLNQLVESNLLSEIFMKGNEIRKREIGCYLSHYNIYNKIKETNKNGYSIIFEDDFILEIDNFIEEINILLNDLKNKNIDFDLLFLGNLNNNHNEHVLNNVYTINNNELLIGCYSYLINNKNINKIIENTNFIDMPIDTKLNNLSKSNKINIMLLYPVIVNPYGSSYSTIVDNKTND